MKSSKNKSYEVMIKANQSWLSINWRELWHYRDLLFLLIRRDFVSRYKQTVLGPLWFVLQPLLMTLVFTVIFGNFAKIPTDSVPPVLFYLCGLLVWTYFSTCLKNASTSFTSNAHIFSKVYFPRIIVPFSTVLSNILSFALQLILFLAFYFYFKYGTPAGSQINPNAAIFLLPLFFLQVVCLSFGVSLWMSALTAKYRDFTHLTEFSVTLWMYATPIIYPISLFPEKWQWVLGLNPMAAIVEFFRHAFFGTPFMYEGYLISSALITGVILITGILIFNKVERNFMDTV